jgi:hypothetical protein
LRKALRCGSITLGCLGCLGFFGGSAAARAQDLYSVQINLFGGAGGSHDAEPGDGFGNQALELGVLVPTEVGTAVGVRIGRLTFDETFDRFDPDAKLEYVTIGGEYRTHEGFYTSGLFLGLGGYRLDGSTPSRREEQDEAFGLAFGVTADFPLTRHFSVGLQLTAHYIDFDNQQLFATGLGGISVRF